MGIRTALPAGHHPVKLEELGVSKQDAQMLEQALGGKVTYSALQRLTQDSLDDSGPTNARAREVARWVQASLRGDSRVYGAKSFSGKDLYTAETSSVLSTAMARPVEGETAQ